MRWTREVEPCLLDGGWSRRPGQPEQAYERAQAAAPPSGRAEQRDPLPEGLQVCASQQRRRKAHVACKAGGGSSGESDGQLLACVPDGRQQADGAWAPSQAGLATAHRHKTAREFDAHSFLARRPSALPDAASTCVDEAPPIWQAEQELHGARTVVGVHQRHLHACTARHSAPSSGGEQCGFSGGACVVADRALAGLRP